MAAKGGRRQRIQRERQKRRAEKYKRMLQPGGESDYARKKRWCDRNGKWGFEVPEPKPWKRRAE